MIKGKDFIGVGCWGIVTNDKNQILLIKKKVNDYWERPGGNVKVGETLEECIVREIEEEIGIKTRVVDFVTFDQVFFGSDKKHWIAFCYHLKYTLGEIKNMEPEKHDDVKWFSFTDLPKKLSPYTKNVIKKYHSKNNKKKLKNNFTSPNNAISGSRKISAASQSLRRGL